MSSPTGDYLGGIALLSVKVKLKNTAPLTSDQAPSALNPLPAVAHFPPTAGGATTASTSVPDMQELLTLMSHPAVQVLLLKQAEMAAQAMAAQRPRADLIPGVCLIEERELPNYTPWTLEAIRARRKAGLLSAIKDPTKPKGRDDYLYNLYDVWSRLNGQKEGTRSTVRQIPADLTVKPLTTSQKS